MVTAPESMSQLQPMSQLRARAHELASAVSDPEIPVISIADLGVLRDVRIEQQTVVAVITPTYSGCPAMDAIADDLRAALAGLGMPVRVDVVLSPAWTTDWITQQGRDALAAYGIAPPQPVAQRATRLSLGVRCPQCESIDTELLSAFGSTACKSMWRCRECREPFDHFKAL